MTGLAARVQRAGPAAQISRRTSPVIGLLAVGLATAVPHRPACATDYQLSSGDKLEFTIAGPFDFHQTVPIDVDGSVSLPLIGEVSAAGRTLAELRSDVRGLISQKEVAPKNPGGPRGATDIIWPDQVSLTIAEYRGVYLNGDVARPGEQKFKPGLTIRQALSMAGGFDILRFRMDNPFIEASQLRGDYEAAWIDYAREGARLARLKSELNDPNPTAAVLTPPLPSDLLDRVQATETAILKIRTDDFRKQKDHLTALLKQTDTNISALSQAHNTEASGTKYDEDEFNRIDGLQKLGTVPMVRVVEARRIMLLSATQALQSEVELDRAKTERETTRRRLEALDDDHRKELLTALQDSQTKLANILARVRAIGDKLVYVGALKTQLGQGPGGSARMTLFRGGQRGVVVDEETELRPGDTVEVALRSDMPAETSGKTALR